MPTIFTPPEFGAPMAPANPSPDAVKLLALRRSTSPDLMTLPGPDPATLLAMLAIGARVPDHRKLFPFRFILFEGEARARAGDILARAFEAQNPTAEAAKVELERKRFLRAPLVVAVVSKVVANHKTPEWEQILTAGAAAYNLLLAANAYGFASAWITEWYGYDRSVLDAFGLTPEERIAGFVYIGSAREGPKERQRPELSTLVTRFASLGR